MSILSSITTKLGRGTPRGNETEFLCPFCVTRFGSPDTKGHLNVNLSKKVVHCLRCKYSARLPAFLTQLGLTDSSHDLFLPPAPPPKPKKDEVGLPEGFVPFGQLEGDPIHDSMKQYVYGRGLTDEDIKIHRIGYCYAYPYANRIIIPIIDDSRVVFWGARATWPDAGRKVLYPDNAKKGNHLFGLNLAQQFRVVVICEAYLDAITTGLNAVGLGGTSLSEVQLFKLLAHQFDYYIIALDGDAPPYLSKSIASKLMPYTGATVKILELPKEHDPNSIGREAMQELIKQLIS